MQCHVKMEISGDPNVVSSTLKEERTVTRLAQPVYALSSSKNPLAWLDEVPVAAGQEANDLT